MNVTTENQNTPPQPTNVVPLRRQQSLPGIGRDIPDVEAAAIALRDKRAEWHKAQSEAAELEQSLLEVMAKNEVEIFDEDDETYVAKVKVGKTKVSVKKKKKNADDSEDA